MATTATAVRATYAHPDPGADALALPASEASLAAGPRTAAAIRGLLLLAAVFGSGAIA